MCFPLTWKIANGKYPKKILKLQGPSQVPLVQASKWGPRKWIDPLSLLGESRSSECTTLARNWNSRAQFFSAMAGLAATTQLGSNALTLNATAAPAGTTKKKNSGSSRLRIQAACVATQQCECATLKAAAARQNRGGPQAKRMAVRMNSTADTPSESSSSSSGGGPAAGAAAFTSSILCKACDGNGAVVCSQCEGEGVNKEDHFGGRFKTGGTCWLCRGKRQMLCGDCNGAGFMGGFMNTQDE